MKIVNNTGYLKGAKTAKNPVNIIPSNLITTQGMAFPIKANGKTLYPNTGQYKFNTPYVVETPLKQDGSSAVKSFLSAINPKNWGVTDYSNKKDFNSAYSSAKKAGKEEFMWNGKRYNTKYAGTPRQEIGAYGAQGKTVNTKYIDEPSRVNLYPPLGKYQPGHIAASPETRNYSGSSVDYGPEGNKLGGLGSVNKDKGEKTFYVYNNNKTLLSNKAESLPTGKYPGNMKPSEWNLFINNCADNVCDAFGIPRSKGIQTPSGAMSKIKEKYPTLDVTGRTYEDYENLYDEMQNQSNEKVLSQAKNIIGIANSPEIQRTGLGHKLISNIQGVLEQEGYKLPKSTKEDGSYDGKFGDETKAALEDYLKKKSKKISKKQDGADELNLLDRASDAAKFTYRIKDKKRRDTQVADMYNNTLDSFRGDTTNAKRHFKNFFTHYGSERFDGVRPLEGYYGFDRKDYDDKTLDSLGRDWHKKMKVSKKQEGTESAKANLGPTIENAKKLKSKKSPQLFPTPTLNFNAPAAKKFSNTPALDEFTREALYGEQDRQMAENSPNVRFAKQKERDEAYRNYVKKNPLQGKATGQADMTFSPVDLAIAGGAGLVGGTVRLASSVLPYFNAPLTVGSKVFPSITAGNILSSGFAADAMVNRLPQVPGQIKRGEYGAATENILTGGLDLLGANMLNPNALKVITDNPAIKVGRDLRRIRTQGLREGLNEAQIAEKQLKEVGITSNQRKAYIPGVSDFLSEYVYPYSYEGIGKSKLAQTIENIIKNRRNSKIASGKDIWNPYGVDNRRLDAWRMYLGKPQRHNTFRMAKTAPFGHSSYSPDKLKDMDIYSVSHEKELLPDPLETKMLVDPITVARDNVIMGGYNRRLSSSGLEYNDIWDLEPKIKITDFLPNKVISKLEGNKFFDKLLYKKLDQNVAEPRGIKVKLDKLGIGKPFMSHGNISDYTWQKHRQKGIEHFNDKIRRSLNNLKNYEENTPEFNYYHDELQKQLIKRDAFEDLPEIKKQGSKNVKSVLKYKNGSKSVSLAFSRGEKDPKGGLTQKGVDKYNRATGGNLKMAVTTPPSKLKPGSKAANRRKSFCARMSGVKGPMEKNGKPTRKALALRKWNC